MCIQERYFILFGVCLFSFAFFSQKYCPGALQDALMKYFHLSDIEFSGLYSVFCWASLLDVVNGYIIEKWWGLKLATYIYICFCCIGSAIFILGGFIYSFWLLVIGRLVIGFGTNPLFLCMNMFAIHWFEEKEVNFVLSMMLSILWLGSSTTFLISVRIMSYVQSFSWIKPNVALSITLCSLYIAICLAIVISTGSIGYLYKEKEKPKHDVADKSEENRENKTLANMLNFHPTFWIFSLSTFLYWFSTLSFLSQSQEFFMAKYEMRVEIASNMSSLFLFIAFICTPLVGYSVDLFGRNLAFYTASASLSLGAHALLSFTTVNPILPVVMLALSTSLATSSWSAFQYMAKEHQITMAYGICQTGEQMSVGLGSIGAGYIVDTYGYLQLEYFYFAVSAAVMVMIIIVWPMDYKNGRPLAQSSEERKRKVADNLNVKNDVITAELGTTSPLEHKK